MAIWGAIGQIIGGMMGGGGGEGKSGQGMSMLSAGLQAGASQSQQESNKPAAPSAQQALTEMMKKKDTGFYGHKTVGSCRKKVTIIGRGD